MCPKTNYFIMTTKCYCLLNSRYLLLNYYLGIVLNELERKEEAIKDLVKLVKKTHNILMLIKIKLIIIEVKIFKLLF